MIASLNADEQIARDKAARVAEKLIDQACKPFNFGGKTLNIGASIGMRILGLGKLDAETAISDADSAMYRAKKSGKGHAVFFDS